MGVPYSPEELRRILQRDEGQFLEFKSLWERDPTQGPRRPIDRRTVRDWIAEYVAAFANADGGILILGVEDDGTPSGHAYPDEVLLQFEQVAERRLRPQVTCHTQRADLDGHALLILEVGPSPEAVMVEGGGFPYRVGDRVQAEPQEVINERKAAYRRTGFELRIRRDATLDDLDFDLARAFLRSVPTAARSIEEVLVDYGALIPEGADYAVTNLGLLLFGREPMVRWHPHAEVRLFRVEGVERRHGAERNVQQLQPVVGPLARVLEQVFRATADQIRAPERLHDLFFRETPEYPEFAWKEALVNAIGHRDYNDQGRGIEIWFYDDRMEVRSPGDLVPPVTLDLLRARRPVHASRNPRLARVLVDVGLMREEGEGVPRMFEEMERSLLHPPAFALEASTFLVTLGNRPVFEGTTAEWNRLVETFDVSLNQKRVLLRHPEGFSNESYRTLNTVDRDTAYREIHELVEAGIVLPPAAAGRGAVYRLNPSLMASKRFLEGRVPMLRRFLAENDYLQNADYRGLFEVSRQRAVRELRELVEAGYLRAEGERRGSKYFAGRLLVQT